MVNSETPEVEYERPDEPKKSADWFRIAAAIFIIGLLIWWRLA